MIQSGREVYNPKASSSNNHEYTNYIAARDNDEHVNYRPINSSLFS